MRLANFDNQRRIPEQIWYEQLRESDNGSFVTKSKPNPFNLEQNTGRYSRGGGVHRPFNSQARVYSRIENRSGAATSFTQSCLKKLDMEAFGEF